MIKKEYWLYLMLHRSQDKLEIKEQTVTLN